MLTCQNYTGHHCDRLFRTIYNAAAMREANYVFIRFGISRRYNFLKKWQKVALRICSLAVVFLCIALSTVSSHRESPQNEPEPNKAVAFNNEENKLLYTLASNNHVDVNEILPNEHLISISPSALDPFEFEHHTSQSSNTLGNTKSNSRGADAFEEHQTALSIGQQSNLESGKTNPVFTQARVNNSQTTSFVDDFDDVTGDDQSSQSRSLPLKLNGVLSTDHSETPFRSEKIVKRTANHVDEPQAQPEWLPLPTRRRSPQQSRNIEKFFKQWLRKRFGKKFDPSTCQKVKAEGRVPSVSHGHSPISLFGYPVFDERSGRTFLASRLPLSIFDSHLVPIRIGAEDYVIQGSYDQINAFLECFEDYEAIASKLGSDGHWTIEASSGPLFLQMQNTIQYLESPFETSNLLYRWGFDRLIRAVSIATRLRAIDKLTGYDHLMDIIDHVEIIGDFIPGISREALYNLWDQIAQAPTLKDRLRLLLGALTNSYRKYGLDPARGWVEPENVNLRKTLTLTLTSYPKPPNGLRATLAMRSNKVKLGEIKESLFRLFQNSRMAYGFEEAHRQDW